MTSIQAAVSFIHSNQIESMVNDLTLNVIHSVYIVVDGHSNNHNTPASEPVRIIHKDQESISAFCLNNVNPGLIALSTPREVQEMDISLLLESPNWMEDECELDILNLNKDSDLIPTSNFLVIQAANDKYVIWLFHSFHWKNALINSNSIGFSSCRSILNQAQHAATNYGVPSSPTSTMAPQSGRGASVVSYFVTESTSFRNSIAFKRNILTHKHINTRKIGLHSFNKLTHFYTLTKIYMLLFGLFLFEYLTSFSKFMLSFSLAKFKLVFILKITDIFRNHNINIST